MHRASLALCATLIAACGGGGGGTTQIGGGPSDAIQAAPSPAPAPAQAAAPAPAPTPSATPSPAPQPLGPCPGGEIIRSNGLVLCRTVIGGLPNFTDITSAFPPAPPPPAPTPAPAPPPAPAPAPNGITLPAGWIDEFGPPQANVSMAWAGTPPAEVAAAEARCGDDMACRIPDGNLATWNRQCSTRMPGDPSCLIPLSPPAREAGCAVGIQMHCAAP